MIMDIVFETLVFLFITALAIFASGALITVTLLFLEWITNQRNRE
jgi:hypothetical protein